jgi:hypothetical protein
LQLVSNSRNPLAHSLQTEVSFFAVIYVAGSLAPYQRPGLADHFDHKQR